MFLSIKPAYMCDNCILITFLSWKELFDTNYYINNPISFNRFVWSNFNHVTKRYRNMTSARTNYIYSLIQFIAFFTFACLKVFLNLKHTNVIVFFFKSFTFVQFKRVTLPFSRLIRLRIKICLWFYKFFQSTNATCYKCQISWSLHLKKICWFKRNTFDKFAM